jgi:hypothetical protein
MDSPPRVAVLHTCGCGWKRYITDTPEWRWALTDHPLYGVITQYNAAMLDVQLHDCYQNMLAMKKSPRSHAEKVVDYEGWMRRKEKESGEVWVS